MQIKSRYGLIGKTLKHSFSKGIHNRLGKYDYELYPLREDQLNEFALDKKISGFNVTIPYKTDIIEYLTEIDQRAKDIGAVNTVVRKKKGLKGYNTDFDGMVYMLNSANITLKDKVVMILGSGGTSKTAEAVAKHLGAKRVFKVSRSGEINYQNYNSQTDVQVIINTTPVGMFPNNYDAPVDLSGFDRLEGVADVVYNPMLTMLCFNAKNRGLKHVNGLAMLVAQAKFASEKFKGRPIADTKIDEIIREMKSKSTNVVLVGMPGSGKSTIAKEVAKRLKRQFIDTDKEIEKKAGMSIPDIFSEYGEGRFREIEKQVLREVGAMTGKVIATGGGVVKDSENLYPLKSNGIIFWIKRDATKLVTKGRPLSKDLETVKKLYEERKDKYLAFSDHQIDNDGELLTAVKGVLEKL
ncbi:MAG: AAA family ATPase [Clostridia bacterium]|nr:AAA family ATPase [Clostridia bacterium]